VSRKRVIDVPPQRVWDVVSDPHHLPRWWPRTARVEDVRGDGKRRQWTTVLQSDRGASVRADYRVTASTQGRRLVWRQDVAGTPFDRILKSAEVEVSLAAEGAGTRVELTSDEALRGLSRLGHPMMRTAAARRLDEALDGLQRVLVGEET
jgi:uncharacterized protein YndB with AHSA1/START domain